MKANLSENPEKLQVGVIGAGSFGTAIANVLASNGHDVSLWVHDPAHAVEIALLRENKRYHPGIPLETRITPTTDLRSAVIDKDLVVSAVPSHVTRTVLGAAIAQLSPISILVCVTKGIELDTLMLMCDVMDSILPEANRDRVAYLSGPSFAKEMMRKLPTAVTVASKHLEIGVAVQQAFQTSYFRAYTVDDVVGVEVAGAVKNVMAIAAGMADGLGFGHNARAAIISRGLAEISRLGVHLGANPLTFLGLAGVGDLVLTCTGDLSRNRTVGLRLGRGETLADIVASSHQVAEGVNTTRAMHLLAKKLQVEMPIVEAIYQMLYDGAAPLETVSRLMGRPAKQERA